jgi:hypothetical protein
LFELNPAPLTAVIGRPPAAVPIPRFMAVPGTGGPGFPKTIGCLLPNPPAGKVRIPVFFFKKSIKNFFKFYFIKEKIFKVVIYRWWSSTMTCLGNCLLKLLIVC